MNWKVGLLVVGMLGILSVVLMASKPFSKEPVRIYSPYWEEIEQLLPKAEAGMTPEESAYLRDLLEKNTRWHNERNRLATFGR
jgi:hypothetical protein